MCRPLTKEEMRTRFLDTLRVYAESVKNNDMEPDDKVDAIIFSILAIFDGVAGAPEYPAVDLVLRPHPDDKQYDIEEGEDYIVDGMTINDDVHLHDMWYINKNKNDGGSHE